MCDSLAPSVERREENLLARAYALGGMSRTSGRGHAARWRY